MTPGAPRHGGNAAEVRHRLGLGDLPLLDFSASLNPLGPPPRALEAARRAIDRVGQYPEPSCPNLVARLAAHHRVHESCIFVGAGSTEIISLIAQSCRLDRTEPTSEAGNREFPQAHHIEPTYGEYRRASDLNGLAARVHRPPTLAWRQSFFPRDAQGLLWTANPDNPFGRAWERNKLLQHVDASHRLLVVVDEAFLPFFPDEAARTVTTAAATRANLVALRSITKIHAMPGLRVGYAVGSPDNMARLRHFQNPWSVGPVAEAALTAALDDTEYLARSIDHIPTESAWLHDQIADIPGLRPAWPSASRPFDAPPRPNWVLASLVDTAWTSVDVHEALARRGILVRECSSFSGLEPGAVLRGPDGQEFPTQGHLRIAVRTRPDNEKLLASLSAVMRQPHAGGGSILCPEPPDVSR
jgi:threonine-phosphate decarboxylase